MTANGVLGQFEEEFGCWVTDHGLTFTTDDENDRLAEVDLPKLEAGIRELIAAARADVETITWEGPVGEWGFLAGPTDRQDKPARHELSCGCLAALPAGMAPGREVLCAGHGPVTIRTAPEGDG